MNELKAINAHGVRKDDGAYYDRIQADEYIAELEAVHTTEITALEVSHKLQLDGLRYDKDAEIRRLKRALYKACANWARIAAMSFWNRWHDVNFRKWQKVKRKCINKAKEYK